MTESKETKTELNQTVLRKLQFKIFSMERDNHKTKRYTDSEMVQKIRKAIDEMVRTEDNV